MLRERLSLKLNRRAALGATAAAALTAGALVSSTSAVTAKAGEAPAWDDSADIVVIGGSGALAAAAHAAEAGLSTIVLEKTGACGGNNKVNGGTFFTCGSRAQMEQGVKDPRSGEDDSIELGIADAASATGGKSNGEILQAAFTGCNAIIDEMMSDGVEFALWCPHEGWPDRCHQILDPETGEQLTSGIGFVNYFEERAENAGARILTNTRARKVIVGDDGRVAGVEVVDPDGAIKRISAKAAIVATGSYACSNEMVARYYPEARGWTSIGLTHATGDGMTMLLEHNIAMSPLAELTSKVGCQPETHGISSVENEYGLGFFNTPRSTFLVNNVGDRFEDETVGYTTNLELGRVMTSPFYIIWDQAQHDEEDYHVMFGWGKMQVEDAVERGIFKKADTVEDLAAQLYIPVENLQASIDSFNATAGGADDEFGRPQATCRALEGPYYACLMTKSIDGTTLAGMQVNIDGNAVTQDGTIVPGLYAAGNDLVHTNWDGGVYIASGTGCGLGFGWSRHVGEKAVEYVNSL